MVDPMPRGKQITTWGWSEQECIARMHWAIALHYKRSGPDKDLDRCLDRSAEDSVRVMEWETVR
jgi:hypothetical protein